MAMKVVVFNTCRRVHAPHCAIRLLPDLTWYYKLQAKHEPLIYNIYIYIYRLDDFYDISKISDIELELTSKTCTSHLQ